MLPLKEVCLIERFSENSSLPALSPLVIINVENYQIIELPKRSHQQKGKSAIDVGSDSVKRVGTAVCVCVICVCGTGSL